MLGLKAHEDEHFIVRESVLAPGKYVVLGAVCQWCPGDGVRRMVQKSPSGVGPDWPYDTLGEAIGAGEARQAMFGQVSAPTDADKEHLMTHAEKCPVCDGSGKVYDPPGQQITASEQTRPCHGCGGKGWVTPGQPEVIAKMNKMIAEIRRHAEPFVPADAHADLDNQAEVAQGF